MESEVENPLEQSLFFEDLGTITLLDQCQRVIKDFKLKNVHKQNSGFNV